MKLLHKDGVLVFSKVVADKLGLNEAIFLQQLHFKLHHSVLQRDGHTWIYHTVRQWQKAFPFWSTDTITRVIRKLERQKIIISSNAYNKMRIDKTKWYRIHYPNFYAAIGQNAYLDQAVPAIPTEQNRPVASCNLPAPITKELEENQLEEQIRSVISYLNKRAGKQFSPETPSIKQLLHAQLSLGKTVAQLQEVIDLKTREWLGHPKFEQYLRPATLFHPRNINRYLDEISHVGKKTVHQEAFFTSLNFEAGE